MNRIAADTNEPLTVLTCALQPDELRALEHDMGDTLGDHAAANAHQLFEKVSYLLAIQTPFGEVLAHLHFRFVRHDSLHKL
jgi:hypothetical protein